MGNIADEKPSAAEILEKGIALLRSWLPATWQVERAREQLGEEDLADAIVNIGGPQNPSRVVVEIKRAFNLRDVDEVVRRARLLNRVAGYVPLLVMAPWLSARSRSSLAEAGINYMDLTGAVRIATDYPPLFIERQSTQAPPKFRQGTPSLRGPKAGRVARLLVDVRPPYGVIELARYAGVTPGYVSRLLDSLAKEDLVERDRRRGVATVDWRGLLGRRAESYGLFTTNKVDRFVCPNGPAYALEVAGDRPVVASTLALTGSFAVERTIGLAPPDLLVLYSSSDISQLIESARLLPAGSGANVVIATPYDRVVMEPRWPRRRFPPRVPVVAASQLALDCLTGVGRMPQEGEAFLDWMALDEEEWRLASLQDLPGPQSPA